MPRPKAALRHQFRLARRELSPQERADFSRRIVAHLLRWMENRDAKPTTIALYLATAFEANLDALIAPLQLRGVRVVAPHESGFALIGAASTCSAADGQSWRVPDGEAIGVHEIDIVLLPSVALGGDGSRLGQGQGWFDRALADSCAMTIGVAFGCQIVSTLPIEEHDVAVQWIASEDGIVEVARRQDAAPTGSVEMWAEAHASIISKQAS